MIFTPLRLGLERYFNPDVLREAHGVLKPGGTFACLEFNKVTNPLLAQYVSLLPPASPSPLSFPDLWVNPGFMTRTPSRVPPMIPLLGTILAGDRASYQYVVESIRRFPSQGDLDDY